MSTCDGETEQSGHEVEDGKMLAGCFVIQLWEDGIAAKEHCERTFGKEGDSPSEYLHNIKEKIIRRTCTNRAYSCIKNLPSHFHTH